MNRPLLSICIPTYNRDRYLKECLDSIICQFKDKEIFNQVEILVSDNASEDNTQNLVKEYQKEFSNIHYIRNLINIGSAKNIFQAYCQSKGKYLWPVCDDDIVEDGALKYLINSLSRCDYSAVLLNFSQGEHFNPRIKIYGNSLQVKEDKVYQNPFTFFQGSDFCNFHGINFASAVLYNCEYFQKEKNNFISFFQTPYLHSYIFLLVARNGPVLRIGKPLVVWRSNIERRVDELQPSELAVRHAFIDYIYYAKELGYLFDESKIPEKKSFVEVSLKGKIFLFLKKYHLLRFARIFYRIPRLLRYYYDYKIRKNKDNFSLT